ncbi:MAG: chromosomal replication initiator protein DnaA [Phycisphaerae bacterium]|nr:chromosomal replication initiator protein DnaA [Phycisphaerae bacterium]
MPRLDPEFRVSINNYLRKHHADLCRHWFDDIEPLDIQSGVLRLLVREPVQLRYLQRCCAAQFSEAAQSVTARLLVVRFIGPDEAVASPPSNGRAGDRGGDRDGPRTTIGRGSLPSAPQHLGVSRTDTPASRPKSAADSSVESPAGTGLLRPPPTSSMVDGTPAGFAELKPPAGTPSSLDDGDRSNQAFNPTHGYASDGRAGLNGTPEVFAVLDEQTLLSPDYTFSNFVVGPNNRLAHAAALAVGDRLAKAYNPFFIHGGVGLGKTHLLQATCQAILQLNPRARISYISCNTFMDLFHDAVRAGRMSDFRSRFRTVDVLVIDDIHFLSKREQTQEEFFHTFNALYQSGKQIILSSDAAPSEIPDLEERLTSRFCSGLVARIDRPDYETRVAIIKSKAALHDLTLPDDVPAYIAAKIDSNIRELEGALTKLRGVAAATNQPITLELAKTAMSDMVPSGGASQPTIQMIIEEVSRFFDVKLTDLLSKRRHKSIALPRQVCMWLARKHTRYSLEEIGGYFGGRDHTTVMHAIKTINEKRGADGKLLADVSRLEEQLLLRVR